MTEEEKIAFVRKVPVGRIFLFQYMYDPSPDVWLRRKGQYDRLYDPRYDDVYELAHDYYTLDDPWEEQWTAFKCLDEDDSSRLLALHAMNEEAFRAACKELSCD